MLKAGEAYTPAQFVDLKRCLVVSLAHSVMIAGLTISSASATPPEPRPALSQMETSGEVFGGFRYADSPSQSFNEFNLERVELGLQSQTHARWGGELRVEGIRSAGPNSLIGVDGDSLVTRVKRAWGYGSQRWGQWSLHGRIGLIPDSWHEVVMNAYPLRALGPSQGEREGFQDTSDLGGALYLGWGHQRIFFNLTNGEGRRYQEQNKGKNILTGIALSTALSSEQSRLHLSIAYRDGSRGPGSGRDHRLYGATWWAHSRFNVGLKGARAWGLLNRPSLLADSVQGWTAVWLVPRKISLLLSGEWLKYSPQDVSFIGLGEQEGGEVMNLEGSATDRSALRWSAAAGQTLYTSPRESKVSRATGTGVRVRIYERVAYRGESNLKSPVFGVPQLAKEWRAALLFSLSWGPMPPQAISPSFPQTVMF